ncbi:MAG: SRPBCC family protein [Cyanobacteriota bacterium]
MSFLKSALCFIVAAFIFSLVSAPGIASTPIVNLKTNPNGEKNVNASIIINAPTNVVWGIVTDYNNFTSFLPGIKQFTITQNAGSNKKVNMKIDLSRLMRAFNCQVNLNENSSAKSVVMTRTSGDFNSLKLSFSIKPLDNGTKTMLNYIVNVDHGNGIPSGFANKALTSNASKMLTAIDSLAIKKYSSQKLASK